MARVVAFVPDLLFGSNVLETLRAAGHEVALISSARQLRAALGGAEVLVIDLTDDVAARIETVTSALEAGRHLATLAFFSHVETDVRAQARAAGFDLVVPRSRMARAMADLVAQLAD